MLREQEQLLALVRVAIHPEEEIPEVLLADVIQWEKIYEEAKKQSLLGIAFVGYKRWVASEKTNKAASPIDDVLIAKWYGMTNKIRQRNLLLNMRSAQIVRNFAIDGFRTSIMKGQGNALLYGPELSLMRSPGDIDVWVEGGFKKVYGYVQKVAPTNEVNELEMPFNVYEDTSIEVHYRPFIIKHPFKNKIFQRFCESQAEACFNNHVMLQTEKKGGEWVSEEAVVTTIPFNLVHQMAHIKLHLFAGGIHLKQVLDYYFLLLCAEKCLRQDEKEAVLKVMKETELERLAQAMTWILSEYFKLPSVCWLWESNREDGEYLLDSIVEPGINKDGKVKTETFSSFYKIQKKNLKLLRFDRTDWFWGSLWRIYHFGWKRFHHFRH